MELTFSDEFVESLRKLTRDEFNCARNEFESALREQIGQEILADLTYINNGQWRYGGIDIRRHYANIARGK